MLSTTVKNTLNRFFRTVRLGNILDEALSSAGSEEQTIDVKFRLAGGGGVVATRKAILSKVGNIVTMVLEPVGKWDSSETIDCTGDHLTTSQGGGTPDETPIPASWRPLYEGAAVPFTIRDAGTWGEAILSISSNGQVDISKDRIGTSFTGVLFGYNGIALTWTVADFS